MAVSKWFDANVYLENKVAQLKATEPTVDWTVGKVAQAFADLGFVGEEGAEAHFMQFGQYEDVAPNAFFNPLEYYRAKAAEVYHKQDNPKSVLDAEVAFVQTAIKGLGMGAWTHYDTFGSNEKINPSNSFDTAKYMEAKRAALNSIDGGKQYTIDEVYAAFKAAGVNALEHFMLYGGNKQPGEVAEAYNGTIPDAFKVDDNKKVNSGGTVESVALTNGIDTIDRSAMSTDVMVTGFFAASGDKVTFNAFDSIVTGSGNDTLSLMVADNIAAADFKAVTVKNVENLVVKAASGKTVTADVAAYEGMKHYTQEGGTLSSATFADSVVSMRLDGLSGTGSVATASGKNIATVDLLNMQGGAGANNVTLATADSLKLNLNAYGKADALQTINMGANVTSLEINAQTKDSGVTLAGAAKMATLKIGGDAKLTIDDVTLSGATLTSIDASGNKGGVVLLDALNAATSFTGGDGDDSILLAASHAKAVNMGKGDDTVTVGGAAYATALVDGGEGIDTLGISIAAVTSTNGSIANFGKSYTNFENLLITDTAASNTIDLALLNAGGKNAFDTVTFTTANSSNTATVKNLLDGDTIAFHNATTADYGTVTATLKDAGGDESINVLFEVGTSAGASSATATVNVSGIETVNITANDLVNTDATAADVSLTLGSATAVTKVVIDGTADTMTFSASQATNLTLVDASEYDGGLNWAGNTNVAYSKNITVNGGEGDDIVYLGSATGKVTFNGGAGDDMVLGGTGNDVLNGGAGDDQLCGGAGQNILTGGAGEDTFILQGTAAGDAAAFGKIQGSAANLVGKANALTITDFVVGEDIFVLSASSAATGNLLNGVTLSTTGNAFKAMADAIVVNESVADLDAAYTAIDKALTSTNFLGSGSDGKTCVAQVVKFSNATYLVINDATADFQEANDIVINITGVTGEIKADSFTFTVA